MNTLNQKDNGYRGIWYMSQPSKDEYVFNSAENEPPMKRRVDRMQQMNNHVSKRDVYETGRKKMGNLAMVAC